MANEIYLSPRKILEHLCVLEDKIPRKFNTPYIPTGEILAGESALNLEAKKMLDYIGLGHYTPICKFTQLQEGTAGCIEMGGNGYIANIKIDKQYQGNTTIILAILAHEVCHKLIFIHGIDFPNMQIVNEVYTDLCTLYIGFGDLIIKGYKTISNESQTTTTHMLGYLKYDMYIDAYEIVRCVYGGYKTMVNKGHSDILLQDTLEAFVSTENKKSLIIEKFKDKGRELSEFHRNLLILEQILKMCYTYDKSEVEHYNKIATSCGLFDTPPTTQNKIKVLKSLYDLDVEEDKPVYKKLKKTIKYLERSITTLGAYCSLCEDSINYEIVKCPNCGYVSKESFQNDNISLIRCHKCRVIFAKNSIKIDIVKLCRECNDFIRDEQEIKKSREDIKERQSQLYNEQTLLRQEKQEFSAYKISIEEQTEQKMQRRKLEIQQEGRVQMWNDMPPVLKWLTKKYVTKKSSS